MHVKTTEPTPARPASRPAARRSTRSSRSAARRAPAACRRWSRMTVFAQAFGW